MAKVSKEKKQIWYIKRFNCFSSDIKKFNSLLIGICKKKELRLQVIGNIFKQDIFLISQKNKKKNKNLLIVGGLHGDEPAGCWAILDYLEKSDKEKLKRINLNIIPILNPSGFKLGNLNNALNENPNRGYGVSKKYKQVSQEGKILLKNINLLRLAKEGLLTLHEDYDTDGFYAYIWEKRKNPSGFTREILSSCKGTFKKYNGITDGFVVKDGLVFNLSGNSNYKEEDMDSIEYFLFKNGANKVVCSETPRKFPIENRIKVALKVINNFVDYYIP